MTMREFLTKIGVEESVITKIEAGMKENKLYTASEENLDIRYGKLKGQFDELDGKHKEAEKLIETLKSGTQDSEALKAKVATYEQTIATLEAQLRSGYTKIRNNRPCDRPSG